MKMKNLIFCVAMNFISAIVLIGAGAMEMNNLVTSVPAILCIIAGICGIIGIKKNKKWMEYILHPLFIYSSYQLIET